MKPDPSIMKPDPSTPKRTIVKALTWESFSTLATFGVAWLLFGQIGTCVTFAVVTFLMKLILFYGHERLWHQIPYGKSMEQPCMEAGRSIGEVIAELKRN